MKLKRQYVFLLKALNGGVDIYDGTLALYVKEYKIKDGKVFAIINEKPVDLLPLYTTVKTLNKIVEFILKDAALSLGGVWQTDNVKKAQVSKIQIVPGAINFKKAGTSGLEAIDSGRAFHLNWTMVESLRQQVKEFLCPDMYEYDY